LATTTLATADAILKEVYEPGINDQLQSEVKTLKRIESTADGTNQDVGGKYTVFALRVRRNHGIGARSENTPLPVPRSQKYASGRVNLTYLYGRAEITGPTMELAKTNPQAFLNVLEGELEGLRETLSKDMNRQVYGTSAGVIGTAVTGTSTTLVMPDADAQYFELSMFLDIWDNSAGAMHTNGPHEVTDITSDGTDTTITISPATSVAIAVNDTAHRTGSRNLETIGFKEIVDDAGTLYNINPTTEPVWKSVVDDNGGTDRALSEGMMIKMCDDVRKKGGKTTVIWTTPGVRRSYFNLLVQQRRFTDTKEFAGGFRGLVFSGGDAGEIPVMDDWDCQPNRMYFINEKVLKVYKEGDWAFMDRDGSKWQRKITSEGDFDAYNTTLFSYRQLGTKQRNSHGLLDDITEAN
jgi:hypothetical protein